jgi:predicted PurR-regulated permease PerM
MQNMLVFIIEDVAISQDIYSDALAYFVNLEVENFEFRIMGLSVGIIVYLVVFVLVLIRLSVVGPITELTDQIMNPKKSDKMEKFVQDIQRRVKRNSLKNSERIDEVEQLRILFSQFFSQTKSIQNKLELQQSLTNKKKAQKRYVMLIEEDMTRNLSRVSSQTEYAEFGLQQVTSTFERFVCQEAQKEKCNYYK